MGTADIEAAINSTPQMMEDLRKSFESLQSYSSSLASFTLQWKDLEDHFHSIEMSIEERFRELKELDNSSVEENPDGASNALKIAKRQNRAAEVPRQDFKTLSFGTKQNSLKGMQSNTELKALCSKMDGEGLISFITEFKRDNASILGDIRPALLSAPDPVTLVLDSLVCFDPSQESADGKLQSIRRTCASILECLNELALDITPQARERARKVAVEWKRVITDGKGDNSTVVLSFLRLIATFGLVDSFEVDDILDLIVPLVKRKYIVDLCRSSAFVGKMPRLIEKLRNTGKQLDAVKFVMAFGLQDKFPPTPLLKAYIKDSKKIAEEVRMSGQPKNLATAKEIDAIKAVIRAVIEYKLDSEYPSEGLHRRIEQLERQKIDKKRGPSSAAGSHSGGKGQRHMQPPPIKRPRPSESFTPPIFPPRQLAHNPAQLGPVDRAPFTGLPSSVDRAPFAGMPSSYSFGAPPSLYVHGNSSLSGEYAGFGQPHASSSSYAYPSQSLSGSGYYDRTAVNGGYKTGLQAYNPSSYP